MPNIDKQELHDLVKKVSFSLRKIKKLCGASEMQCECKEVEWAWNRLARHLVNDDLEGGG